MGADFRLKMYKYRISRMPTVFTTSKMINHALLPSLAAFQSAKPFQTKDHKIKATNNRPATVIKLGGTGVETNSCQFIILKLISNNKINIIILYQKLIV